MSRGGYRPGSGRKPWTDEQKTAAKARREAARSNPVAVVEVKKSAIETKPSPAIDPRAWIEMLPQVEEISRRYARNKTSRSPAGSPFRLPQFPKVSTPSATMAMDSDLCTNLTCGTDAWLAGEVLPGLAGESLVFLGYAYLSELAQRPEYRVMAETIADDATRKWIDFDVVGDARVEREKRAKDPDGYDERMADPDQRKKRLSSAGKLEKVKALRDDQLRLGVKDRFYEQCRNDGFFGRSHLFLDIHTNGAPTDEELKTPIGDGRDSLSRGKVPKGSLKRLQTIEPVWSYPLGYNAINPLDESWYNPQVWYVMGKEIHGSRLQTFIGHPVPDMLKPAYAFGGLSLTQMAKPYVDIWLQTRQSVSDLIHSFSVMVLMTDLSTLMQSGNVGALLARAAMFNMLKDNNGLFVANKNTEDFKNVSASLAGLHELQSQAQEHIACLPAGTLIETARGQVPIETVTLEDRVLTREGFSSLKWVGVTGQSDALIQIKGDGFEISATRYHPIWSETDQDFVAAESVSTSHRLRRSTSEANTDRLSLGEVGGGGKPERDTTETKRRAACFIASCGKRIAVLFQKDTKYTIGTMTGQITIGIISKFSPGPIISRGTRAAMSASSPWLARLAGMSSRALSLELCFARAPAKQSHAKSDMGGSQHPTRGIAKTAESHSRPKGVTPGFAPAHACSAAVLSVSEIKVPLQPVYNLEVDGLPEFFANGVLVHNSVHRIPLVKFTGIQPSGLNASSEGEIKVYDDTIMAYQSRFIAPNLTKVVNFEQLSLFGEIDPAITFRFQPLREMTQAEKGQKEKDDADRNQKYVDMGALHPSEVRTIIINDPELPYTELDPDDVPDLLEEENEGLEPQGGRPQQREDGGEGGVDGDHSEVQPKE